MYKIKNTRHTKFRNIRNALLGASMLTPLAAVPVFAADCAADEVEIAVPIVGSENCVLRSEAIFVYISGIIQFLSIGVGLVVTLMIVVGAIQYITSAGNPQHLEAAKKKIYHAIEALILFIFMAAILNFIIPGGIL